MCGHPNSASVSAETKQSLSEPRAPRKVDRHAMTPAKRCRFLRETCQPNGADNPHRLDHATKLSPESSSLLEPETAVFDRKISLFYPLGKSRLTH